MRLCKKAAACLLAAVMAVSMLTACGGDAGGGSAGGGSTGGGSTGGGSNPGGGSSTVEPAPDPDDIVLPGSGDEGQEGAKKIPIEKSKSKLYAFNVKAQNATESYAEETVGVYDADGKAVSSENITMARADSGVYEKISENGVEAEEVFQKNSDGNYDEYILLSADKVAVKFTEVPGAEMEAVKIGYALQDEIYSTTVKVKGIDYYAETYTNNGVEYTVCFGQNDMPKYEFDVYPSQRRYSYVFNAFQFGTGASRGLCKLPAGTKVYKEGSAEDKVVDEDGNEYQVTFNRNDSGDITSVTVTDKNGHDVTDQFQWAMKLVRVGIIS